MKRLWFVTIMLVLFLFGSICYATPTVTDTDVDEWAETAQNAVREGDVEDISANYGTYLHIDIALTSAAVHTGSKITVFVSSKTSGDEDWTTHTEFIGPVTIVAPNPEALGGAEAAGQTVLEIASTTGYDADATRWIFLEDNVVVNSEMLRLISHVGNTSVTIADGLALPHDASDTLYNVAMNKVIFIPMGLQRVKIEYDNTYDSNGATIHTRARRTNVTAL